MKAHDLYGIVNQTKLEAARQELEQILGIQMLEHESLYHGGVYYRHGSQDGEHFMLKHNHDLLDDEWTEPEFVMHPCLLYVHSTPRSEALQLLLEKDNVCKLLRHREK